MFQFLAMSAKTLHSSRTSSQHAPAMLPTRQPLLSDARCATSSAQLLFSFWLTDLPGTAAIALHGIKWFPPIPWP